MPEIDVAPMPEDFASYEAFRRGETPEPAAAPEQEKPADTPAAKADEPEPKPAPESDPEKTEEHEGERRSKGGFQTRIDHLTRDKRELERNNRELERRVQELESRGSRPAEAQNAQPAPNGKPALPDLVALSNNWTGDYASLEQEKARLIGEYAERLSDWKDQQRIESEQRNVQQKKFQKDIDAAEKKYGDGFEPARDEVKSSASEASQFAISSVDNWTDVVVHLSKHPEQIEQLNSLPPLKAAALVGQISAKLSNEAPEPPKPAVSKAPAPVKPVGGVKAAERSIYDEDLSFAEHERIRQPQLRRR